MQKQYHTRQRFEFQKYDAYRGTWEKAGYLLMPNEVEEFHRYLNELDWSFDRAFERVTGKAINDETNQAIYKDIALIVETVKRVGS
jgi:hypothetical protein